MALSKPPMTGFFERRDGGVGEERGKLFSPFEKSFPLSSPTVLSPLFYRKNGREK